MGEDYFWGGEGVGIAYNTTKSKLIKLVKTNMIFGSGALSTKILLVRIIENNKI